MALPGTTAGVPTSREASVIDHWAQGFTSVLLNSIPTVYLMIAGSGLQVDQPMIDLSQVKGLNIKSIAGGGKSFRKQIMHQDNSTVSEYDGKESVPADEQDPLTYVTIGIKAIMGRMTIYDFESAMIQSPEALVNWLNINRLQLHQTLVKQFGTNLWDDGTGNSSKRFDGIRSWVNNTAAQAYGGITPTDLDDSNKWDNYRYTTAIASFNTTNAGLNQMHTMRSTISLRSGESPDLYVTHLRGYDGYIRTMTGTIRANMPTTGTIVTTKRLADIGYEHLNYVGAPLVLDNNCPVAGLYALNTKYMKLMCLRKAAFKFFVPHRGYTVPAETVLFEFFGNLLCDNRRAFGVISNITDA